MKKLLLLGAMGAAIFGAPTASAAVEDVVLQVNAANGKSYRANNDQLPWGVRWTSNNAPVVTVGMTNTSHGNRLNCANNAEYIVLQSDAARTIEYAITVEGNDYYVSSYSFNAFASAESMTLNDVALTVNEEVPFNVENIAPTATSSLNVVFPSGTNTVQLRNFTITLSPSPESASVNFNFGEGLTSTIDVPVGTTIDSNSEILSTAAMNICPWGVSSAIVAEPITVSATGENNVNVTPTWALPFEANKPYRVKLRPTTDNTTHAMVYVDGYGKIRDNASTAAELNPASIWYFQTATPVDNKLAFTIHTLATEEAKGMHFDAATTSKIPVSVTDEPSKFFPVKSTRQDVAAGDFCLRADLTIEAYVNEHGGNGGDHTFAIWYQASNNQEPLGDPGSVIRIEALTDADFDNHQSWTTTDGETKYFEPNAKAAAKASKSVADLRTLFTTEAPEMTYGQACDALTAYAATKVGKLTATTLFNEAEAQAVIAAVASIDENAENFETALAEAKNLVDAIDINAETTKKMNGRKVIIRNIAGANGSANLNYITGVATGETVNTALLSPAAVWSVVVNDDNTFVLHNLVKDNYLNGSLQAGEEGSAFRLANNGVSSNNANSFAIQNISQSGDNFLNNNATTNETLRHWSANSGNASSFWTIAFADEQEAAWLETATANYVAGIETGNEPGKYIVSDPDYATKAALCAQVQVDGEVNYPVLAQLVENPISGEAPALFDIHSITGPALVRIKTSAQSAAFTANGRNYNNTVHYLCNSTYTHNNTARMALTTDGTGAETIFVLENVDGAAHISTYLGGEYGIDNNGLLGIYDAGTEVANNHGLALTFNAAAEGTASENGAYYISHNLSNGQKSHVTMWGTTNAYADRYSGANPGRVYAQNVNVEYVKSLNLSFDSYTLWRTPVAVKFVGVPDAYTVKATGSTVTTTAVDTETEYAAGTAFFLNGQIELQVLNNAIEATAVDGIVGHHAIKAHTIEANKVVLTVAPATADTPAMLADQPVLPTVKMAVEIPTENEERTLAAHNVLLVADNADKNPLQHGGELAVVLGGDTTTTGIFEVNADNATAEGAVYDLQGRRLAAPVKGINIINGKKVLVK